MTFIRIGYQLVVYSCGIKSVDKQCRLSRWYEFILQAMKNSTIAWLENLVQGSLKPDLTLLLDAPVEIGMERARSRGNLDRFESEKIHFFEQVRRAYLLQAELHPSRIKVIKTNQPLIDVENELINVIGNFLR